MGTNLANIYPNTPIREYLDYWNDREESIRQYRRDLEPRCEHLLETLNTDAQVTDEELIELKKTFGRRDKINLAPGFRLTWTWTGDQATAMDSNDTMVGEIASRSQQALACWGQKLPCRLLP